MISKFSPAKLSKKQIVALSMAEQSAANDKLQAEFNAYWRREVIGSRL
jgi:hypothetical protein